MYANDIAFFTPVSLLDRTLTELTELANNIRMTINAKKTKSMQILY